MKTSANIDQMSKIDMSLDDIIKLNKRAYRRPVKKVIGNSFKFRTRRLRRNRGQRSFQWRNNQMYQNSSNKTEMLIYQNQNRFQQNIDEALERRMNSRLRWQSDLIDDGIIADVEPAYEYVDDAAPFYDVDVQPWNRLQQLILKQKRAASYLLQLKSEIRRMESVRQALLPDFTGNTLYSDALSPGIPPITVANTDDGSGLSGERIAGIDTEEPPSMETTNSQPPVQTVQDQPKQKKSSLLKISIINSAATPSLESSLMNPTKKPRKKSINFSVLNLDDLDIKQATTGFTLHQRFTMI